MPKINLRTIRPWLSLLTLILTMVMAWQAWAQPGGLGRGGMGGGPGGGPGGGGPGGGAGPASQAPRFDPRQATTIKGTIVSLGSYGLSGWRATPGMAVQGLVLKTAEGNIEVTLGPPDFVKEQRLKLNIGDNLEIAGFKATRNDAFIFVAAEVKAKGQTLKLLDDQGFPLWRKKKRGPLGLGLGGPGAGGEGPDGGGPGGEGPGGIGPGGMGRGRM